MFGLKRFKSITKEHPFNSILNEYSDNTQRDLNSFLKFLEDYQKNNLFGKNLNGKIQGIELDVFDYSFCIKITSSGRAIFSLGSLLCIDSISTLLAGSHSGTKMYLNPSFTKSLKNSTAFIDYTYLLNLNWSDTDTDNSIGFIHCLPKLPGSEKGFFIWCLYSNLLIFYFLFHELAHIQFQHHGDNHNLDKKVIEFEADSYAAHKMFIDFYKTDFLNYLNKQIDLFLIGKFHLHEVDLFKFICQSILCGNGIINALDINFNEDKNPYPSARSRILNCINTISSARVKCIDFNKILSGVLKEKLFFEISQEAMIFYLSLLIKSTDWIFRFSSNLPILILSELEPKLYQIKEENSFRKYNTLGDLYNRYIDKVIMDYMILIVYAINQIDYHEDKYFNEWIEVIRAANNKRRKSWEIKSEVNFDNFSNDAAFMSTNQYFHITLSNFTGKIDVTMEEFKNISRSYVLSVLANK